MARTAGRVGTSYHGVSYHGVSVRVPASWPVLNLARHPRACPRLDVHAVYLGTPGPDPACPAGLRGRATAVQIEPVTAASPDLRLATRRAVIGGRAALTNTGADQAVTHEIIDVVPSAGTEIAISWGQDAGAARSIGTSVRVRGRVAAAALAAPAAVAPGPSQGTVTGPGFDTCAAPSAAAMRAWLASPYRSVGIYIGGVNRACAQANLTAAWIRGIQAAGWHYFPLYAGLQASCVAAAGDATISPSDAAAQGAAAARDAVTQAAGLGIPPGTPVSYDMEAYGTGCTAEVTTFLSAWDGGLRSAGYVPAVYESASNVGDLAAAAGTMTEPQVLYYADWDGQATTSSSYLPAGMWASHQRIHQYAGGHTETWGGTAIDVDSDQLDVTLGTAGGGGGGGGGAGGAAGATRPGFRVTAAINANGTAEWFATAASGTLQHDYQHPVGTGEWWGSRAVGNSPGGLTGNPAVAAEPGGALTVFARTAAGQVVHAWQEPGAPNDWEWGGPVGSGNGTGGGSGSGPVLATDPGAITAPDGDVTVLAATASGQVYVTVQQSPGANTSWTAWASLGGDCAGTPVPFAAGGTLEAFCVTVGGGLAQDVLAGGRWGGWQVVPGGPGGLAGTPAVVAGPGGETEVAVTAGGHLADAAQAAPGGSWTWSSPVPGVAVLNSPAAVAWPGGGIAVLAQQAGGQLGMAVQGPGGWGAWTALREGMLGSPATWVNADGNPEVAVLDRRLQVAVSTWSGGSWGPWTELGGGY
jgi:hypothetical protein